MPDTAPSPNVIFTFVFKDGATLAQSFLASQTQDIIAGLTKWIGDVRANPEENPWRFYGSSPTDKFQHGVHFDLSQIVGFSYAPIVAISREEKK